MQTLSDRGASNIREILDRMAHHIMAGTDHSENSSQVMDLSMAANMLVRGKVNSIIKGNDFEGVESRGLITPKYCRDVGNTAY